MNKSQTIYTRNKYDKKDANSSETKQIINYLRPPEIKKKNWIIFGFSLYAQINFII